MVIPFYPILIGGDFSKQGLSVLNFYPKHFSVGAKPIHIFGYNAVAFPNVFFPGADCSVHVGKIVITVHQHKACHGGFALLVIPHHALFIGNDFSKNGLPVFHLDTYHPSVFMEQVVIFRQNAVGTPYVSPSGGNFPAYVGKVVVTVHQHKACHGGFALLVIPHHALFIGGDFPKNGLAVFFFHTYQFSVFPEQVVIFRQNAVTFPNVSHAGGDLALYPGKVIIAIHQHKACREGFSLLIVYPGAILRAYQFAKLGFSVYQRNTCHFTVHMEQVIIFRQNAVAFPNVSTAGGDLSVNIGKIIRTVNGDQPGGGLHPVLIVPQRTVQIAQTVQSFQKYALFIKIANPFLGAVLQGHQSIPHTAVTPFKIIQVPVNFRPGIAVIGGAVIIPHPIQGRPPNTLYQSAVFKEGVGNVSHGVLPGFGGKGIFKEIMPVALNFKPTALGHTVHQIAVIFSILHQTVLFGKLRNFLTGGYHISAGITAKIPRVTGSIGGGICCPFQMGASHVVLFVRFTCGEGGIPLFTAKGTTVKIYRLVHTGGIAHLIYGIGIFIGKIMVTKGKQIIAAADDLFTAAAEGIRFMPPGKAGGSHRFYGGGFFM